MWMPLTQASWFFSWTVPEAQHLRAGISDVLHLLLRATPLSIPRGIPS